MLGNYENKVMSRKDYGNKEIRPKPCDKCGSNRWKTLVKGKKWMCRICHNIRTIE